MTFAQFMLSFGLGGAVAYGFGTAVGLKRTGLLREHPFLSIITLAVMSCVWPFFAIRDLATSEKREKVH